MRHSTSQENKTYHLTSLVNKVGEKGRVNVGTPGFGVSVSPYVQDFDNHLEPAVRDLVYTLLASGFKTVGSCQGHHFSDNPFVILAFGDYQSAEAFCQLFRRNIFLYCAIGQQFGDDAVFGSDDIIVTTADEVNQWFGTDYDDVVLVRLEVKSQRFLWMTNIGFIKKPLCNMLSRCLKKKLSNYEHIT